MVNVVEIIFLISISLEDFHLELRRAMDKYKSAQSLASLPMLASLLQSEPMWHTLANMSLFHFTVAIVIFSNHGLVPAVDFLAFAEQFCTNEKP